MSQIAAMDIGSTKVVVALADVEESGLLRVLAVGSAPNDGVRNGTVVDIETTAQAILQAVRQCEQMADRKLESVVLGVTGEHISGTRSPGIVPIVPPGRTISSEDVHRVITHSKQIPIPAERQLLHVVPVSFKVDGQAGVTKPVGMNGERLEVEAYLVTGLKSHILNLERCVNRAQIEVEEVVLQPLATSESVTAASDRQAGCAVVDIGGYSTDVAVFRQGGITNSCIVPVGGAHVTGDLVKLLKTTPEEAERLKLQSGSCVPSDAGEKEAVPVRQIGAEKPRPMARRVFCEIIEARVEENLMLVRDWIEKVASLVELNAGVVITGGGAALTGMDRLAARIFGEAPIRVAKPTPLHGLGDVMSGYEHAAIVGLLKYAQRSAAARQESQEVTRFRRLISTLGSVFGSKGREDIP